MPLEMLPCCRMLFFLFIADSMGVSESLEGRYLRNLCQVIKSNICPQKDRSTMTERVSLRKNGSLIQFFAGEWPLLLPSASHLRAAIGFLWSRQVLSCLCMQPDGSFVVRNGTICEYSCSVGFFNFEEIIKICSLMFYPMITCRHLLHSLCDW